MKYRIVKEIPHPDLKMAHKEYFIVERLSSWPHAWYRIPGSNAVHPTLELAEKELAKIIEIDRRRELRKHPKQEVVKEIET